METELEEFRKGFSAQLSHGGSCLIARFITDGKIAMKIYNILSGWNPTAGDKVQLADAVLEKEYLFVEEVIEERIRLSNGKYYSSGDLVFCAPKETLSELLDRFKDSVRKEYRNGEWVPVEKAREE